MYVSPHLSTWQNVWRRIAVAVRYVFGHKSRYGAWDELLMKPEQVVNLTLFLERYLEQECPDAAYPESDGC
jgi:hypothetical protein